MSNADNRKNIERRVLEFLNENTDSSTSAADTDVAEALELTVDEVRTAFKSLKERGYVNTNASGLGHPKARITAAGKDFLSGETPAAGGMHFHNTMNGTVHLQQGSHQTMYVTHNTGLQAADVLKLVQGLKASLHEVPAEHRGEAQEQIEELEILFGSENPRPTAIKNVVRNLFAFAVAGTAFYADVVQIAQAYNFQLPGM
ncbi:hypothetical protein [Deinococcus cellulosilyticus]|uniref:Uncharacterized protein n=1 Tax=Deinococcus cellulosilyticus (strain DSM 18568 / NBRC 106333 / KACC 11606 / 5516J-15) TaxID=1223518 RepID=A0A511NCB4_DEIC1|nr:hypothetical protein [Deinococcus cellulosilyticus]GEM49991.1 hypothetical protein DC3_56260 [Deinococcus cellulosilyticus NBRC 106333 = KACC 11606]